jgi:PliI/PliC-like inhibitor of I-type lysozyme
MKKPPSASGIRGVLVVCLGWTLALCLGCRVESRREARGPGSAEKTSQGSAEAGKAQSPGESSATAEETGAITLESAGIRAHVLVPGGETTSIGTYLVHIALPGGTQEIRENRDGVISGAWLGDLDGDGEVDLTVAMTSAGSGSYPTIHFFHQQEQAFELRSLKDLTAAQRTGYMGHDSIEVKEGKLLRTFPKYLPGDSNSSPSGGTVILRYSFSEDGWFSP